MKLPAVGTCADERVSLVVVTSPDGVLLEANQVVDGWIGADVCEILAVYLAQAGSSPSGAGIDQQLRAALQHARGGRPLRFRGTHGASGGALRAFEISVTPLASREGVVARLVWEARNVAPPSEAEEELRASSRMLELVLDTIPVRVFWKDTEGRYLGCNSAFARDAGLAKPEELVGKRDFDLSWQTEAALYRADDRAVMTAGAPRIAYEEPQTRPDGTELWLRTSKIPLRDGKGAVVGVLGVYEDITASKEAEKQRRELEIQMLHAQKLESLGVLAGGIAHDFNNLLMAVLGNADLLRTTTHGAEAMGHLQALDRAAHRARDLCRQLLAYSGRGRFVVQAVDVSELARETTQLFALSVSKAASLELLLDDALPAVQADATQLRQVLMNLVTNASEALVDGFGTIRLRTRCTALPPGAIREDGVMGGLPAGNYVVLEVEDTGSGMDPRTRARVFEPFFTTKFTGRGLGLAAVLGIVRGHGGAVQVESEVGKGSLFRVFLPAAGPHVGPAPRVEETGGSWGGHGRILFVDDEPMVLSIGVKMVRHLGFEVDTAVDGRKALGLYSPDRYVCVILDVTMPQLDGIETMRRLREIDPRAAVVLSSGFDANDVIARLGNLRADAFLEKPFLLETLRKTLREVTEARASWTAP
ncbi:MAG: PAS domain-containing protein [Myxococcota bacterium]|nr:PAS domain-containing protein [Myxococcota bacterium]